MGLGQKGKKMAWLRRGHGVAHFLAVFKLREVSMHGWIMHQLSCFLQREKASSGFYVTSNVGKDSGTIAEETGAICYDLRGQG